MCVGGRKLVQGAETGAFVSGDAMEEVAFAIFPDSPACDVASEQLPRSCSCNSLSCSRALTFVLDLDLPFYSNSTQEL